MEVFMNKIFKIIAGLLLLAGGPLMSSAKKPVKINALSSDSSRNPGIAIPRLVLSPDDVLPQLTPVLPSPAVAPAFAPEAPALPESVHTALSWFDTATKTTKLLFSAPQAIGDACSIVLPVGATAVLWPGKRAFAKTPRRGLALATGLATGFLLQRAALEHEKTRTVVREDGDKTRKHVIDKLDATKSEINKHTDTAIEQLMEYTGTRIDVAKKELSTHIGGVKKDVGCVQAGIDRLEKESKEQSASLGSATTKLDDLKTITKKQAEETARIALMCEEFRKTFACVEDTFKKLTGLTEEQHAKLMQRLDAQTELNRAEHAITRQEIGKGTKLTVLSIAENRKTLAEFVSAEIEKLREDNSALHAKLTKQEAQAAKQEAMLLAVLKAVAPQSAHTFAPDDCQSK
jgi:hypothetical protein